ncbi:MAG: threonine/serine exporter family protein [Actinomycetia bacterium]|nr:threonine/serine exporter family protein [Actinomycetes bacterium]
MLLKTAPPALAAPDHYDLDDITAMLREIGAGLIEVAQPIQVVETRLVDIAAMYTSEPLEVAAFPTMLLIQIGGRTFRLRLEGSVQPSGQFDTAATVDRIADLAQAGAIDPTEAVAAVHSARRQPPRFGAVTTTLGYALTAVGFGMVLQPSWKALLAHLFLGLVVGTIMQISRPLPGWAPILPTLSAMVVTLLATWFVADAADNGLLPVISPALIATLPGMALVVGSIELAGNKIISGASRVVYGVAQLGLMVYGVVLGVQIAGQVPPQPESPSLGAWSFYMSILVISIGLYFYLSAPRGSLIWLLLTIAVAMGAQALAGLILNAAHSGFVGAMVAIPFAIVASRVKNAPPATVLSLAAFWSLVPGQLTFMSVSRGAAGDYADQATLSVAGAAIISIALGTLVGWTLVKGFISRPGV